jgi:spectinomycin phosphotransferase
MHQVMLPPEGFPSLRTETFDPSEYARRVATIEAQHAQGDGGSQVERALHERWLERQPTIHALLAAMETLAAALRTRSGPRVICHADLHPSNLIRDRVGRVFLIDWDDVMLAPRERDFLFVGDPPTDGSDGSDGSARAGGSPFFQGYGPAEIDWVALTYYRCERIVQDVIECAQAVYFRDDLGDDVKAEAVELFAALFAPGPIMLDAARVAATHLPPDFSVSIAAREKRE